MEQRLYLVLVDRAMAIHRLAQMTSMARARTNAQLRRMIRKLKSGEFRLYSRKKNPRTGKRRNLGTFRTLAAAKQHERAVQFFKRR